MNTRNKTAITVTVTCIAVIVIGLDWLCFWRQYETHT